MAVNWGTRLSGTSLAWGLRVADAIGPVAGVLRFVGQQPTIATTTGSIDGGGEITFYAERDFTAFYELNGYIASDLAALYQIALGDSATAPTGTTLRVVGRVPTVAVTLNRFAAPSVGSLRFAGQTPTVSVSGDETVAPATGTVRVVGNAPNVEPQYVFPATGTMRLVGQLSGLVDLAHKVAAPVAGVLRFVGFGVVTVDLAVQWQMLDLEVSSDFAPFWQRGADIYGQLSPVWNVYSAVSDMTLTTALPSMVLYAEPAGMDLEVWQQSFELAA